MSKGLRITRRFTEAGKDPYDKIEWSRRDSRITNPDGSVVFEMTDAEIPAGWSQVAADIMVSKYFRKAGVPQFDEEGNQILDESGEPALGAERSAKQVFNRLAGTWRHWGEKEGYFASTEDAEAFEDELKYMLSNQMAAPNSPQWFNTGLNWAYGLTGPAQGFWYVDSADGELKASPDSYSRPAPHACFPEGTRITTREGFKTIEKLEPGDEVLTHLGRYRKVSETMQRQVDEDLVRLHIRKLSGADLTSTANHPILAVRGSDARRQYTHPGRRITPEWIPAGDLQAGDYVVVAKAKSSESVPQPVDLSSYVGSNFEVLGDRIVTRNSGRRVSLNRYVSFADPDIMRLFGRWLGDGSIGHETRDGELSSVNFVFDADDARAIGDVISLMTKHFGIAKRVEFANGQRTAHLRYTRRPLARFFSDTFGEGFAGKRLPQFVYDLPREHRLQLLVGLFHSDGCVLRQKKSTTLCFDQSNQDLAEGIWRLARSLGYSPGLVGGRIRPGGTVPHYRVMISAKDAPELARLCHVAVPDSPRVRTELQLEESVAYRISSVTREPFYGTVYNFQVEEDESYVANGVVVHNCFILSVKDDLVNPGGIMDLWVREARIFKFGSGAGSNFSEIRAENERLSGGGKSSGVMSFLKIGDRAAGAIKSGGTTRRAAKMVILDVDHPDIEKFIDWKKVEEEKARVLINQGGLPADFNGDAYATVSGQNSNNSVRVTNEFIQAVLDDGDWNLYNRTDGSVRKTVKARDLWNQIAEAAWACADPGLQFDTTINEWHTSPAGGRIRGSNPCSEFVYLNDTACNLASINLVRFYDDETGIFDVEAYQHAVRIWTIVLEISVAMAHFPSPEIARGSYDYRPLGLGYANLGSLLMRQGIAYDSDEGRAISGALTAILTGYSYATSAEIAGVVGPFPRFRENREPMLRVIGNHRRAAYGDTEYERVSHKVMAIDPDRCPEDLLAAARTSWDLALQRGEKHGYRNGQASVIAPTGTIGLLMDCDTTGVEPDFALVKFKKLAGGGYFKIANQSVAPALKHLGYDQGQIKDVVEYIVGTSSIDGAPHINRESLAEKGFTYEDLDKVEKALPAVFELRHAFNVFTFGEQTLLRLGFGVDEYTGWEFNLLKALGFSSKEINEANDHICGRQTIEGAPHVKDEHLAVFDTANKNGKIGERFIHHHGHIKMMAAAQPFISGAISKCVTGGTLLATADGLVRIGSLHDGEVPDSFRDEVIEVASRGGTRKTDAFYYGGVRPVRQVTLRSGHKITGTPNHRVLVAGEEGLEWRALADIRPGEHVAMQYGADMWSELPARFDDFKPSAPYGNQKTVSIPAEMSADLAFLVGAIVAEGNVTSNRTIHVSNADEGVLDRVSEIAQRLFNVEAPIRRPKDRCPSVEFSSKTIVEFIDYLGVGRGAHHKRIPDAVLRSPRHMVLAFLSGLFLDGYVALGKSVKMAITTASAGLMDDLQAVLTNLGVVHGRVKKYVADTDSVYHEVYAAGREAKRLARFVPFAEKYKAARAAELLKRNFAQSTADVVPGITGRELYEMMPLDRLDGNGRSERLRFIQLLDPRTTHVSRRTLERVAMVPGVELPEWLTEVISDQLHFSPVTEVVDDGEREVYDLSVPDTHAFVGNGIVNHNTINMPNEITVEDIEESYRMSWEWGLKAMALYRDGSKAAQPLNSTSDEGEESEDEAPAITTAVEAEKAIHWGNLPAGISPTQAYRQGMKPPRFLLPARRNGYNQEARIGGHKVFLRTGEYDDGTLGEIFIDLAKEGATLKGILSCFAIAVSKGLQYGVPLEEFVDTFTFQTFEPRGMVEGHPNIKMANSIVDYVFRALGVEYLERDELAQVPPNRDGELPEPASGIAIEAGIQLDLTDAVAESDVDAVKAAAAFVDAPNGTTGNVAVQMTEKVQVEEKATVVAGSAAMVDSALKENMGDAPVCSNCGHMTIRNGSCYVCLTCGDTTGCS